MVDWLTSFAPALSARCLLAGAAMVGVALWQRHRGPRIVPPAPPPDRVGGHAAEREPATTGPCR